MKGLSYCSWPRLPQERTIVYKGFQYTINLSLKEKKPKKDIVQNEEENKLNQLRAYGRRPFL